MSHNHRLLAHSNPQYPDDPGQWEPLLTKDGSPVQGHINRVASLCAKYVDRTFQAQKAAFKDWSLLGEILGRWHDLGKFSNEFQNYLLSAGSDTHTGETSGKVDHTSAGAQYAMEALPTGLNSMIAYPIAGHHAGLLDGRHDQHASLLSRLRKEVPKWREFVSEQLLTEQSITLPHIQCTQKDAAFRYAFAVRMLFSCLVDADFLATEAFMNPEQAAQRPKGEHSFPILDQYLTRHLDEHFSDRTGPVAEARADVLAACRARAGSRPGLYSLSVPTGGGKTLSSLAFGLRHCALNRLDRVVYAIPFTSIIEQNAAVFRKVFEGYTDALDGLILEHHSNFDPQNETTRTRLSAENWDAPLIVTTNVQLFESLFANRTSRCRKLHHIANSVIILDEAQTLPVSLLAPCLRALQTLVEQYGCTVVLCTATQPAIEYREKEFEIGLSAATQIIDDAPALYRRLKRVEIHDAGTLDCTAVAGKMGESKQGLAIVNTRKHAAALYETLKTRVGADSVFHLSAAMTPEHRSLKLNLIRQRLGDNQPCRVIATQLIEAGVDVDFPVVWRALAGLDSIAQAAGRCNREGLREKAVTWVFRPAEKGYARLFGTLRSSANAASQVIGCGRHDDLLGLDAVEHYFRLHYWQHQHDWDKQSVMDSFRLSNDPELPMDFDFATVAENFHFIEQTQRPVVVPWDDASQALVEQLRGINSAGQYPDRSLVRRLQRNTVTVSMRLWETALHEGNLEMLCDRFAVLTAPQLHYSNELGLQLEADPLYDPNDTIV